MSRPTSRVLSLLLLPEKVYIVYTLYWSLSVFSARFPQSSLAASAVVFASDDDAPALAPTHLLSQPRARPTRSLAHVSLPLPPPVGNTEVTLVCIPPSLVCSLSIQRLRNSCPIAGILLGTTTCYCNIVLSHERASRSSVNPSVTERSIPSALGSDCNTHVIECSAADRLDLTSTTT